MPNNAASQPLANEGSGEEDSLQKILSQLSKPRSGGQGAPRRDGMAWGGFPPLGDTFPWSPTPDLFPIGPSPFPPSSPVKPPLGMADILRRIREEEADGPDGPKGPAPLAKARVCAEGVEAALGGSGVRHFFRQALAEGRCSILRSWAVVVERGMQDEILKVGFAETMMAAAFGSTPRESLSWLAAEGFSPSRLVASLAMQAYLAAFQHQRGGLRVDALEILIKNFGAGSCEPETLALISKIKPDLGAQACANGEAFEIEQASDGARTARAPSPRL